MATQEDRTRMIESMWTELRKLQEQSSEQDSFVTAILGTLTVKQQKVIMQKDMLDLTILLLVFRLGFLEGVNHGAAHGWENALAALDALCDE